MCGDALGGAATPIPPERLHVSLPSVGGFSGPCPPATIDAATRAADTASLAAFKVEFNSDSLEHRHSAVC